MEFVITDETPDLPRFHYPELSNGRIITCERRSVFNCISWSLDVVDEWIWPGYHEKLFDDLNAEYGYEPCEWDEDYDPLVEKIVLYRLYDRCTHQAKQVHNGWTSKMGACDLIWHESLDDVAGPYYGTPYKMYSRPTRLGKPYNLILD